MVRGRKSLPTELKKLRGNPGKRKPNQEEPKPDAAIPECPEHLKEEARAEWKRLSAELHALGLLTRIDRAALAAYCVAWCRWVEAEEQVKALGEVIKSPNGFPVQNPYLSIANKAMKQLKEFLIEFGLTPASRARVKSKPAEKKDPMQEFLQRGQSK